MVRLRQEQEKQSGAAERLLVPVILPLDTAWETFEKDGKDFLHSLYHQLDQCPWVKTVTPSSFLADSPKRTPLAKLAATIPATGLYSRWIGTEAQNAAWRELGRARQALEAARKAGLAAAAAGGAERLIMRAEGREFVAALAEKGAKAEAADRSFRDLLSRAYRSMARAVPPELGAPLAATPRKAKAP